jgi:hypothetical protein
MVMLENAARKGDVKEDVTFLGTFTKNAVPIFR